MSRLGPAGSPGRRMSSPFPPPGAFSLSLFFPLFCFVLFSPFPFLITVCLRLYPNAENVTGQEDYPNHRY